MSHRTDEPAPASAPQEGGDAVCWLERVCDACGGLVDGPPQPACPRCGEQTPGGRATE